MIAVIWPEGIPHCNITVKASDVLRRSDARNAGVQGTALACLAGMVSRRSILTGSAGAGVAAVSLVQTAMAAGSGGDVDVRQSGVEPDLPLDQSRALQQAMDRAARTGGRLLLPAGNYVAGGLVIRDTVFIAGVPGRTRLISPAGTPVLTVREAADVVISGLILDGADTAPVDRDKALAVFENAERLVVENCRITGSAGNGMALHNCSGHVMHNEISSADGAGLFALDSAGLEIAGNHVHDCADNGVLVWQSQKRDDGTIVAHNRIERIGDRSGGSGQYGNGVNVFRAGGVVVSGNVISDCAWSAVRDNAGDNVQIVNNTCRRIREVALFVEFAFKGAVVTGNIVDTAGTGVSITNFNDGGRLAVCANNMIINVNQRPPNHSRNVGIFVEADTVVSGNVVEAVPGFGYVLGWGRYCRNISATGNIARQCDIGFGVSVAAGAGPSLVSGNIISDARDGAIVGMDHDKAVTGDLAVSGDVPEVVRLNANLVS